MNVRQFLKKYSWFYVLMAAIMIGSASWFSQAVTVSNRQALLRSRTTVVIDAGHGGMDGGATSCTGVLESRINLEVSLRVNDLLQLMGYHTAMIRTDDSSVDTEGSSIAQRKASDLKNRVRMVHQADHPLLISIHQNQFSDRKYDGAQVFYAQTPSSQTLAQALQSTLVEKLNPGSRRKCKQADGVYLMQHIDCPGILIECGFLSNPAEEARLRSEGYQKQLACVIVDAVADFLEAQGRNPSLTVGADFGIMSVGEKYHGRRAVFRRIAPVFSNF